MAASRRKRGSALDEAFEQLLCGIEEFQGTITPVKRKQKVEIPSIPALRPPMLRVPRPLPVKKEETRQTEDRSSRENSQIAASPDPLQPGWLLGEDMRFSPVIPVGRSPRFPSPPVYHPCVRQLSPEDHQQLLHGLRLYRQSLSQYTPQERLKSLRLRFTQASTRLSISKAAHIEIENARKRRFEADMEIKLRRFRWRQCPEEVTKGKKMWVGVAIALGVVEQWRRKGGQRRVSASQELHIRSQRTLMLFLAASRICGKTLRKAKQMRYSRLFKSLQPLKPYIRRWKSTRRHRFVELITDFLENSISRDVIYRLVTVWKQRVLSYADNNHSAASQKLATHQGGSNDAAGAAVGEMGRAVK